MFTVCAGCASRAVQRFRAGMAGAGGWWRGEGGAEVPEYVLVVAIIAMLAVGGLVAVKAGLTGNLNHIASCLTATASGTANACS